jgi:uncharacterized protein (DUF952 family)
VTPLVYKILRPSEWTAARQTGVFSGSPHDARDGFIHLCAPEQVRGVCERHFAADGDLVLLTIDVGRLESALRWEASHQGEAFPHLYAPLPLTLVRSVDDIRRGPDGGFAFPPGIP